jgi:hypothetical protein
LCIGNMDRALLQQGLPQDDGLYLVIGGHHDLANDNGDGGRRWQTVADRAAMAADDRGGV